MKVIALKNEQLLLWFFCLKEVISVHMADALITPLVGGVMWVASSGVTTYSVKKIQKDFNANIELSNRRIPLMGVMGAFVFASQMINFTIPGTGASGHIGGGILLAVLLGQNAGFITLACILAIQALFFADGGLLSLGCNIFNMGFFTCYFAYPIIYKKIVRKGVSNKTIIIGSLLSVIIGLQLGAFSVVLQTFFSGKTELPFETFVLLMQPIHLIIGVIEGLITAAVLIFVWKVRPEILNSVELNMSLSYKKLIITLISATVLIGGVLSLFASSNPDGLEWSIEKTSGSTDINGTSKSHELFEAIQTITALLPNYNFNDNSDSSGIIETSTYVNEGTYVSGIVGSLFTLFLAVFIGTLIKVFKKIKKMED